MPDHQSASGPAAREPILSVVLVARDRFDVVRRTVAGLRAQTIRDDIELCLVTPSEETIADREPGELRGFASVRIVPIGACPNIDKASAHGFLAATSALVAHMEDHVFPEPDWAEAVVRAHRGAWSVVGGRMINANPASMLSWANALISHEAEVVPQAGEATSLSSHNATYKTAVLRSYGDRLSDMLGRDGGLMRDLRAHGYRIGVDPAVRFHHQQVSRWSPNTRYRFNSGRNYGATRMRHNGWSLLRRMLYVIGAPLIPLVRTVRLVPRCRELGVYPRVIPALFLGLILESLGEMTGYAAGPGRSLEIMADYEVDRPRFMSDRDRMEHRAATRRMLSGAALAGVS
jgi:hypothetical protein